MKKLLSFVLVLVIVLGSICTVCAEPALDILIAPNPTISSYKEPIVDYISKLKELGAVEGDENGDLHLSEGIIRAEAAAVLVKIKGKKAEGAIKASTSFTDVVKDDWYSGYINVAFKNGYIDGVGDGKFNPKANISMDEAVTMLLKVLGYTSKTVTGTWPENYRALATEKDILDGVTLGAGEATRADFFRLMYNCLDKGLVEKTEEPKEEIKEDIKEEDPVVSEDLAEEAAYIAKARFVTLAAFVNKYSKVSATEEGEVEYFAQFKTNGTNYVATYEVSKECYASLSAIGQSFALNIYRDELYVKYIQEYKVIDRVDGVDVAYVKAAVSDDDITVENGEIKFGTANRYPLCEKPWVYKYSEDAVDVASLSDVKSADTVTIYDVNRDGFIDIILLNFFDADDFAD